MIAKIPNKNKVEMFVELILKKKEKDD